VMLLSPEPMIGPETLEQFCLPSSPLAALTAVRLAAEDVEARDEAERIQHALLRTAGNVARAARLLGMSRGALRHRLARAGIVPSRLGDRPVVSSPSMGEGQGRSVEPVAGSPPAQPSSTSGEGVPSWEQKPVAMLAVEVTWPEAAGPDTPRYERWTVAAHWERVIIEKVHGFGGVVLQRLPSLLMAAFGIPQTQEHLPQRAVQTALTLRNLVMEGLIRDPAPSCARRSIGARCWWMSAPAIRRHSYFRWARRWRCPCGC
jgi:hypothetical protein